jgi:hypothetical protein
MPPICSVKYNKRLELARLIEFVSDSMLCCSFCERNNCTCIVSKENSKRCSECVCCSTKCDVASPSKDDISSILREGERLQHKEEEAIAKILCLRKQQRLLKSKRKEMLCCGLKTMDELDNAEEKEKQIELEQAATAAMLSSSPRLDALAPGAKNDPFAGLEVPLLPLEVWAN